jgi:hypothetical protein
MIWWDNNGRVMGLSLLLSSFAAKARSWPSWVDRGHGVYKSRDVDRYLDTSVGMNGNEEMCVCGVHICR